jgi:hypothetical protein
LRHVLTASWTVAHEFIEEGRVKGHFTGSDWPQVSRAIMTAFLRAILHPRLWAVRGAHADSSALRQRWVACWLECRQSARFIKMFVTYSCSLWRRFPESALHYAPFMAHMTIYGGWRAARCASLVYAGIDE